VKKILIIENSLYVTGGLNAIISAVELLKQQYEFHFIIPQKSKMDDAVFKGHKVSRLSFLEINRSLRILFYLPRLYKNAKKVLQYMRRERIDILHVNDIFNMVGCVVKKKDPSISLVYHVRLLKTSYIAPLYPIFTSRVIKYADAIICVSEAVKKDIRQPGKAKVIYDAPHITDNYKDWNGLSDPASLKILYLANYTRGKGQQYGLKAFVELQKKYPASSMKFAGVVNDEAGEQFKQELSKLADEAGVASKVSFAGKVRDVEKEMKEHDVVLNLSESESFSFVCLEALLYGVPLVASNSGGPAEITDRGQVAALVENKNYLSAAAALEHIIKNPEESKEKARRGKQWARQKFNPELTKLQLQELYSSLIKNLSPVSSQG
jgi:glycosyltransferase involved in cell wall biosynthesis